MKHNPIVSDLKYLREPETKGWKLWLVLIGLLVLILLSGWGEEAHGATIGVASFYDYKIGADGWGRPCQRGNGCWTETRAVAASRDYPRGSIVRVTNLKTNQSVAVQITDWIEHPERDIDLSSYAFNEIGDLKEGLLTVRIEPIFLWLAQNSTEASTPVYKPWKLALAK